MLEMKVNDKVCSKSFFWAGGLLVCFFVFLAGLAFQFEMHVMCYGMTYIQGGTRKSTPPPATGR